MGQLQFVGYYQNLLASTTATATATTAAITIPMMETWSIHLNTTAASGTTPTLDMVLLYTPDGTNYVHAPVRFAQVTAVNEQIITFKTSLGPSEAAWQNAVAATGGGLAKNFVLPAVASSGNASIKFKYTIGGTNPSFTFIIHAVGSRHGTMS